MMSRKTNMRIDVERFLAMTAMMAAPLLGACGQDAEGPEDGSSCAGGKCDEADGDPANFACQNVRDEVTGGTADLTTKNDALARLILKSGGDCPQSYQEVIAKLKEAEPDCSQEGGLGSLGTIIVSETAALLGLPEDDDFSQGSYFYRSVINSTCGGRQPFELLFSQFGLSPNRALPENAEVIAMDKIVDESGQERSIFNYYALEEGQWTFHGNSINLIEGEGGRCKNCHASGGLLMKELASPWLHWDPADSNSDGSFEIPGSSLIVDNNADVLGQIGGSGAMMEESIVEPGNLQWQDTRVRHLLQEGNLRRLLGPMFCATEANLGTGDASFIPPAALVDASDSGFSFSAPVGGPFSANGLSVDADAYERAVADQFMTDAFGRDLKAGDGSMLMRNDTVFALAFPQRAWSDLDVLDKLKQIGVIDAQLQAAVAGVDFTRPVFSDARCELLGLVDDVGPILGEPGSEGGTTGDGDSGTTGGDTGLDTSVDVGNCCEERQGDPTTEMGDPGCTIPAIQECVCAQDSFCCDNTWDSSCVGTVNSQQCLDAVGASGPVCDIDPTDEGGDFPTGGGTFGEDITVTEGLPDKIRDMLRTKLEAMNPAADSPEGQLLANLDKSVEEINAQVQRFITACDEMDDDAFLAGYMVALSKRRRDAEALPQYEFAATFPQDNRDTSGDPHLDPETCELKR
jgi:hypothetical protein